MTKKWEKLEADILIYESLVEELSDWLKTPINEYPQEDEDINLNQLAR